MLKSVRAVSVVVKTVAVIWGASLTFSSAVMAGEQQLVNCVVQSIESRHEFEEGLDARHNKIVDLYQNTQGAQSKMILQLGAFQDFDTYRGDKIEFKQTKTFDSVVARYQEFKWSIQIDVARSAHRSGYRAGTIQYREDPRSQPVLVAKLECK